MCKVTSPEKRSAHRLLYSRASFDNDNYNGCQPSLPSCLLTIAVVVALLCVSEKIMGAILLYASTNHEILQNATNRAILARHIGVDTLSCCFVAFLGWQARHMHAPIFQAAIHGNKKVMPQAAYATRLFTYHPDGFRIALLFFAYQVKNMYDTIVWGDGPEYIFHHCFSILTAFGSMYPGCGHYYCIFFFGLCEISTAVVCLLANFDDVHGVPGLGDYAPMLKIAVGTVFIILFVTCRCILWPIYSYYFAKDVLTALRENKKQHCAKTHERRVWLKFFLVSLTGLSVLQIAWLGQIFVVARVEFAKVGLL
jgi:hypothetical protein